MLNLFKKQWLPDHIRSLMKKKFPEEHHFTIWFNIAGENFDIDSVVGNERHANYFEIIFTDSEKNQVIFKSSIYGEIGDHQATSIPISYFIAKGIDPEFRKNVRVGKAGEVEKVRAAVQKKLSDMVDYCPGTLLDETSDYPITDIPRWRRKKLLNLLANLSEESIPVFVKFDLSDAALDQLERFNDELDIANLVENKFEPELKEN